ncbi:tryptamine 5-hydroxylase-like [Malania oleifera]|uniref:tryptamine 5-hydroxylase-like n=1 Tax=Malania oleifera TaxID=397392 RepID=UPI0025AE26D1|nr:tryptamine 5-hydroxylase-like [Malania oleifera]
MDEFALRTLSLSSLLLATFTVYLLRHKLRPRSPPSATTLPSPPRLPLIGHLHLLTDMPHHALSNLALKLGPIFSMQLGRVPAVVISSAALARDVLKTHDHVFSDRPQLLAAQYLSFGCSDVTFSRYGPYWRQARKICVTELLSQKRVGSFEVVREEEVNRLVAGVGAGCGGEVDVSRMVFRVANDVLCRVAFGRRFGGEGGGGKGSLVGVLTEAQVLFAGFCAGDFYPEWEWVNWVSGCRRRLSKNLEELRRVCDEIIEEHVNGEGKSSERGREDFVDVLLRVQSRDDLEVPITDDNLKALVLDMFVAGTDTTSATLEWAMTELITHPKAMQRAQEEVRKMGCQEGRLDETLLQHLHYMKAVIKETLRLHPPAPLLVPRESMEKCTLDVYEIPARTRVLINAYAIGRDPESWDNPLLFNPERFSENNIDVKGQDFRFLPFGGGRRGCPGSSFGLATVEIALARLLYHFDWALPTGVRASDVDKSEIFGLATRKKTALVLIPTAYKGHEFK